MKKWIENVFPHNENEWLEHGTAWCLAHDFKEQSIKDACSRQYIHTKRSDDGRAWMVVSVFCHIPDKKANETEHGWKVFVTGGVEKDVKVAFLADKYCERIEDAFEACKAYVSKGMRLLKKHSKLAKTA